LREWIRATAKLAVVDEDLDVDVKGFAKHADANEGKGSILWRRFFPTTVTVFIRESLPIEVERVLSWGEIFASLPESSPLRTFSEPLRAIASRAQTFLQNRLAVQATKRQVSLELEEWKLSVNRLFMTTQGELLKIAAENGRPRNWVNAFFLQTSSRSVEENSEDKVTETEDLAETTTTRVRCSCKP
jgi:hypothetical protein